MLRILTTVFFILISFSAKAVTFQTYSELYECVDTYNNFIEYKKNLKNCFQKKNITIENDSLELIKKDYGVIDDVIELDHCLVLLYLKLIIYFTFEKDTAFTSYLSCHNSL